MYYYVYVIILDDNFSLIITINENYKVFIEQELSYNVAASAISTGPSPHHSKLLSRVVSSSLLLPQLCDCVFA